MVGKGENVGYQHFPLFPQCFCKGFFPDTSKGVIVWEWVKKTMLGKEKMFVTSVFVCSNIVFYSMKSNVFKSLRPEGH